MKLTANDVTQIATLARLTLTEAETEMYRGQLSQILEYVDQLAEVDTAGVEPTAQVTGLTNGDVADVVRASETVEPLLANVPQRDHDYIKVPAVFNDRSGA